MRRMSNSTEPLILSPMQRAAVLRTYKGLFNKDRTANKPRKLSFAEAMRLRARWVCGEPLKELARRYLDDRDDHAALILSGRSYLNPSPAESSEFEGVVATFYAALDACDLGPADAVAGTPKVLPLEQFIRGEFKPAPVVDDLDEGLTPVEPQATAPAAKVEPPPFVSEPFPYSRGECSCRKPDTLFTQPANGFGHTLRCRNCDATWSVKDVEWNREGRLKWEAYEAEQKQARTVIADPFA